MPKELFEIGIPASGLVSVLALVGTIVASSVRVPAGPYENTRSTGLLYRFFSRLLIMASITCIGLFVLKPIAVPDVIPPAPPELLRR